MVECVIDENDPFYGHLHKKPMLESPTSPPPAQPQSDNHQSNPSVADKVAHFNSLVQVNHHQHHHYRATMVH